MAMGMVMGMGLLAAVTGCANNVGGADICAAQQQYAVLCNGYYVDATCQHDAACEFALYKDELILTAYECVQQNVAAMNCNATSCAPLMLAQQILTQTQQLGPLASAFIQSCTNKVNACATAANGAPVGISCAPSNIEIYLDQVFDGLVACESVSCDQYAACLDAVIAQNVGPGCLSLSSIATP
jgi:hypothetical protein